MSCAIKNVLNSCVWGLAGPFSVTKASENQKVVIKCPNWPIHFWDLIPTGIIQGQGSQNKKNFSMAKSIPGHQTKLLASVDIPIIPWWLSYEISETLEVIRLPYDLCY